ncbi:hypothetical protein H4N55_09625 [Aeromonas veronii]|uniref:hypothetical protein n=1 Tax=Aeromonas TaxID=642 RepID=UPI000536A90E|nr:MULTISPECIES: hypothetical protein [Aeromonas]AUU23476.1 hypothetical protein MC60_016875 [Aeromonas caviae]MBF3236862.1 hypothetical protein [Aeromonas veronii]MBL0647343.1 hypothetical protein [Aeromonas caviae]MDX7762547.1 hypothetical protein [Aeromonas caviae]MDX7861030.1 hypothetical protein [Aeromonas caviae]
MTYYAWAPAAQQPTFIGPANPKTGKRSQAGSLSAFACSQQRDAFIASTNGMARVVTATQARQLKAGLDERAFNELVSVLVGGEA